MWKYICGKKKSDFEITPTFLKLVWDNYHGSLFLILIWSDIEEVTEQWHLNWQKPLTPQIQPAQILLCKGSLSTQHPPVTGIFLEVNRHSWSVSCLLSRMYKLCCKQHWETVTAQNGPSTHSPAISASSLEQARNRHDMTWQLSTSIMYNIPGMHHSIVVEYLYHRKYWSPKKYMHSFPSRSSSHLSKLAAVSHGKLSLYCLTKHIFFKMERMFRKSTFTLVTISVSTNCQV